MSTVHSTGQELRGGDYEECGPDDEGAFPVVKGKGADSQQTIEARPTMWMRRKGG